MWACVVLLASSEGVAVTLRRVLYISPTTLSYKRMLNWWKGNLCSQGFGDFLKGQGVKTENESISRNPLNFAQRKARWVCSSLRKAVHTCLLRLTEVH